MCSGISIFIPHAHGRHKTNHAPSSGVEISVARLCQLLFEGREPGPEGKHLKSITIKDLTLSLSYSVMSTYSTVTAPLLGPTVKERMVEADVRDVNVEFQPPWRV